MLDSLENLLVNGLVGLSKLLSSLGMTDDNVLNACIYQHSGRNLAGESTLLLEVHVLSTDVDVAALSSFHSRDDVDSGYAEYYIYFIIYYEGL